MFNNKLSYLHYIESEILLINSGLNNVTSNFRKNQQCLTETLENENRRLLKLNLSLLHKRNHSEMESQDDEFDVDKVKAR